MDVALNEEQAAAYLGIRPPTLRAWRKSGRGPRFYRAGRLVRYRKEELDLFVTRNTFGGGE